VTSRWAAHVCRSANIKAASKPIGDARYSDHAPLMIDFKLLASASSRPTAAAPSASLAARDAQCMEANRAMLAR
jgi:hypothetical protein